MEMKKVVYKLSVEDDTPFEYICSFMTEKCVGIYNHVSNSFIVFTSSDVEFHAYDIGYDFNTLKELDKAVYNTVSEHIVAVSDDSHYKFNLI